MIEEIEGFKAEFGIEPFLHWYAAYKRKIHISESGSCNGTSWFASEGISCTGLAGCNRHLKYRGIEPLRYFVRSVRVRARGHVGSRYRVVGVGIVAAQRGRQGGARLP